MTHDQERERFEAWIADNFRPDEKQPPLRLGDDGNYYSGDNKREVTTLFWKCWQAAQPSTAFDADEIYEAYKSWPADIKAKLSLHDLRRMNGWTPEPNIGDWRIDTSAGAPILVYQNCSVIESEQARYVMHLLKQAAKREPVVSEAMAKDAERYRFLRDTQATIIYKRNAAGGTWEPLIDTRETSTRCGSLDEATDKAMAEATTPRGG